MGYEIETEYEVPPIRRMVKDAGSSGHVYVPKEWIGREVDVAFVPEQKEE